MKKAKHDNSLRRSKNGNFTSTYDEAKSFMIFYALKQYNKVGKFYSPAEDSSLLSLHSSSSSLNLITVSVLQSEKLLSVLIYIAAPLHNANDDASGVLPE